VKTPFSHETGVFCCKMTYLKQKKRKRTMLKKILGIFFPVLLLAALLLSACSASITTATPTNDVSAIYTAGAQTIEARPAKPTATSLPTSTVEPSITPTVTETLAPSPIPPTSPAKNFCDNSAFIVDVTIPDHTVLAPMQVFEKTWRFLNTGTCTWTEGYTIIFLKGDLMGGNTRSINQKVAPQQQVDVTVRFTAPGTPGDYTGFWRLANSRGAPFGEAVSVVIKVSPDGAAATTAPTSAETPTLTPQP
jgi:hypothetical protein